MAPVRVLVVDDSVVVRRLLQDEIGREPGLAVAGTAASGAIALAKINQLSPDVVTLDVEMDGMSGLETLGYIRKEHPELPVIMLSALTLKGTNVTIEALLLGASDYVAKPIAGGLGGPGRQAVREELVTKIKAVASRATETDGRPSAPASAGAPRPAAPPPSSGPPEVLAIASSTGGPNALLEVLSALPKDLDVPVLVVQHMPPVFTKLLADSLAAKTSLRVAEGVDGARVEPGQVWIAPGDHHMTVVLERGVARLRVFQGSPENSCRPAADVLYRSVAEVYGGRTLAVVLTGMGQDGFRGCERIREVGGRIVVQDEATSVVWGMPGFVARAGLAEAVLPLDRIGAAIAERLARGGEEGSP